MQQIIEYYNRVAIKATKYPSSSINKAFLYFWKEIVNALFSQERYYLINLVNLTHLQQTWIEKDIHVPVLIPRCSILFPEREKCILLGVLDPHQTYSKQHFQLWRTLAVT